MSASPSDAALRMGLRPGFLRRLAIGFFLAVLVSYLVLAGLTIARRGGLLPYVVASDLISNLSGAAILESGRPLQLYDRAPQAAAQDAILHEGGLGLTRLLPFVHMPFEALLIAPLHAAGLSYPVIFGLWTLLGLAATVGGLLILRRAWPLPPGLDWPALLAAITFFPVYTVLLIGQSSALLFLAWAAGTVALRRGQDGWAGVALALAAVKPQALPVLLFVLLIMRRWRALGAFAATLGTAVAVTLPFLGWDWPLRYVRLALSVGGYPPDPTLDPAIMHNWRGLVVRLLGDTPAANLIVGGLGVLTLALVAWAWLGPGRGRWEPGTHAWDIRWAGTLLAHLLITPYLLLHDLTLALVPAWILLAHVPVAAGRPWYLWLGAGWGVALLALALPLPFTVLWMAITVGIALLGWARLHPAPLPTPGV